MVFIACISYYFQIKSSQETATANSVLRIGQIKQILDNNQQEIDKLKENLREDYFIRAKAVAYIVQNRPDIINSQWELKKITALLQVDEIHLFNKEGTLYAGTEPEYYNYTFNSGEQMQFFLPMLEDKELELCQDIRPNTAEAKLMQYAAVWKEDKSEIVQIGMEPVRLLEAMKKNELSHIFTMVTADKDNTLFAADSETGEILGATDASMIGKGLIDYGIKIETESDDLEYLQNDIILDELKNYCIVEEKDDVIIGVSIPYESIYENVQSNMVLIIFSLVILSIIIVTVILKMLDYYIIEEMYKVNNELKKIEAGDLDYRIDAKILPEFRSLSDSINQMVVSLLENTVKLSLIFQNVNIPIAVYEYNSDMKRVLATSKIGEILGVSKDEMLMALEDQSIFIDMMNQICKNACLQEDDIYLINKKELRYIKMKSYKENKKTLGILVDMTEEMIEKLRIQSERDNDFLTGLCTRRAFYNKMDDLFQNPGVLKTKAVLMMDVDNLKQMNDQWGHEYGDRLLENVANILKRCEAPYKLIARLSGDEFAMFLYNMDSEVNLKKCLERLHQDMVNTVMELPDNSFAQVKFSCGYTVFEDCDVDYHELLKVADKTMYEAKKNRKGEYVKYNGCRIFNEQKKDESI